MAKNRVAKLAPTVPQKCYSPISTSKISFQMVQMTIVATWFEGWASKSLIPLRFQILTSIAFAEYIIMLTDQREVLKLIHPTYLFKVCLFFLITKISNDLKGKYIHNSQMKICLK